jgi:hypothetical protein
MRRQHAAELCRIVFAAGDGLDRAECNDSNSRAATPGTSATSICQLKPTGRNIGSVTCPMPGRSR